MIDWPQLEVASKKLEQDWHEYGLDSGYLTDFVVEHSDQFSHPACSVREYFSDDALAAILALGVRTIDANRRGVRMVSIGSGGIKKGSLENGPKLTIAFAQWARAGVILFCPGTGEDITRATLLKS